MVSLTKYRSSETGIGLWGKDNSFSFQPAEFTPLQVCKSELPSSQEYLTYMEFEEDQTIDGFGS